MSTLRENEPGVTTVCSTMVGELDGISLGATVGVLDGESWIWKKHHISLVKLNQHAW